MTDLIRDCNHLSAPEAEFRELFCVRCRNPGCEAAGWSKDHFGRRVATQADRLLNPLRADPRLPKYAQVTAEDFADMLAQAVRYEVASRRGDWDVPDLTLAQGMAELAGVHPAAVQDPSRDQDGSFDDLPGDPEGSELDELDEFTGDDAKDPQFSPVRETRDGRPRPPAPVGDVQVPRLGNVPEASGGWMLGGAGDPAAPGPVKSSAPVSDPWATPVAKPVILAIGARVRMGLAGPQAEGDKK